jgi:secreted trypsin-like serine protease
MSTLISSTFVTLCFRNCFSRMAQRRLNRIGVRIALLVTLVAPLHALALVGGAGVAPNGTDSPWNGVGSLSVGGGMFTGTLIAPGYVLTAAHLVVGVDPSTVTFQVNATTSYTIAATQIFVNPGYTGSSGGNVPGDPTNHDDLAIIKLASPVSPDVPVFDIYAGSMQSKDLTFVSYAGSTNTKRTGENIADVLFADTAGIKEVYLFDFDGPDLTTNRTGGGTLGANREASLVGGDSGSSAFVNVNGVWKLAGINTFSATFAAGPADAGAFGSGGGGIIVSAYSPWIDSIVAAPVPEPQTWLMLLTGIGILGTLAKRRGQPV